VARST